MRKKGIEENKANSKKLKKNFLKLKKFYTMTDTTCLSILPRMVNTKAYLVNILDFK